MTFKECYETVKHMPHLTPARQFVISIAKETKRSEKTVQQWLSGCQEPPEDAKRKISAYLQEPQELLFPSLEVE